MKLTLEAMIQQAAKRGELSHLSIAHSPRGIFSVSYRGASSGHYFHSENADPVQALKDALKPPAEPDFG